jgi:hypothetical protein
MWLVQEKNYLENVIICNDMRRQVFGFAIGIGIGIGKSISQNVCFGNSLVMIFFGGNLSLANVQRN